MKSFLLTGRWLVAVASPFLTPTGAVASPVISELFYDAIGSDDGQSFVEIYGEPGTPLDGWVLEGINGSNGAAGPTLTLSGAIPSDGFFVVADRRSDGTTDVLEADWLANFDFQNGPDSVVLSDGFEVVDALAYGDFAPDEWPAGEGESAPDAPPGSSLSRVFADVDLDDNALDFEVIDAPTPGSGPVQSVPEPGASALLGTALAGLAALGRRYGPRS